MRAWLSKAALPPEHIVEISRAQLSTVSKAVPEFVTRRLLTLVVRGPVSTLVAIPNCLLMPYNTRFQGELLTQCFPTWEMWLHFSVFFW